MSIETHSPPAVDARPRLDACCICGTQDTGLRVHPFDELLKVCSHVTNRAPQALAGCCFTAAFWLHYMDFVHDPINPDHTEDGAQILRSGGWHYVVGSESAKGMRGFGGSIWYYRLHGSKEWRTTSNLWSQGEIPVAFRSWLPDNADLMNEYAWARR